MREQATCAERLRKTVLWAYTRSKFYRSFYDRHDVDVHAIRNLQDYDRIPFLSREDLLSFMQARKGWCVPDQPLVLPTTTGTTGRRLVVPFTQRDIQAFATDIVLESLKGWGYGNCPLNGIITGHPQDLGTVVFNDVARVTGGKTYALADMRDSSLGCSQQASGESGLFATVPLLLGLLDSDACLEAFRNLNLKYVFTFVTPWELRARLHLDVAARLGDIHLIPVYASMEMGMVGAATPGTFEDAYVHVEQPGLFHVQEGSGSLVDTGRGELIYTSLGREAFPFIKYRVEDVVSMAASDDEHSGRLIRFEARKPLTVKVPDAAGYFIDILKVQEIVKRLIPRCQVVCVYGEHVSGHYLFAAIFVGVQGGSLAQEDEVKKEILRQVILAHVPTHKIREVGIGGLVDQFTKWFPTFFVDVVEIPKEPTAMKPTMLLNLVSDDRLPESEVYRCLLSRLHGYL